MDRGKKGSKESVLVDGDGGPLSLVLSAALGMALFVRQPCYSPFPNLWTLGALLLFATAVAAAPLFTKTAETTGGRGKRSVERQR